MLTTRTLVNLPMRRLVSIQLTLACFAALLVAILLETPGALAKTETADGPFSGADIVFIVDQSGSMGGKRYGSDVHPNPNDPDDRRFEVSRFAIDFIAQLRYTYGPLSDRDWDVRTAVVYFGDTVETPIRDLTIAPDSPEQWQTVWNVSESLVSPESFGVRNLGNTNIRAAFTETMKILDEFDNNSSGRRRRAVILVTDGLPVVVIGQRENGSDIVEPWSKHMAELKRQVNDSFSGPDDLFYVVALNDADPYWEGGPNQAGLKRYWQEIVRGRGFAELVPRNEEVTGYVQRAVNEVIDPFVCDTPGAQGCPVAVTDTVKVLPYLNQITFILHKIKVSDQISFVNAGNVLNLNDPTVTRINQDRLVETITFRNPPPGIWDVVRPEGRSVTIFKYELLRPLFRFDLAGTEASLGCGRPVTLRAHFLRPGDLPVTEIPGYPVNLHIEVRWPDGVEGWDMGRPSQPGLYEQREFVLGHGTNAEVWLKATTNDPENVPLVLYHGNVGSLTADECRCELAHPLPQRMAQYDIITPTLALVNNAGRVPLEIAGEYEMKPDLAIQGGGVTAAVATVARDGLSASTTVRPMKCADISLGPTLSLRDVQTGREKSICTLPAQTIGVDCRTLVRMISSPPSITSAAACNLLGSPSVFRWKVRLEDEQGQQLKAVDALARPGQLPFTAAISSTTSAAMGLAKESWTPAQLPPAQSDYEWSVTNLAPGRYDVQLNFPANVATGYIKDISYLSYQSSLDLGAPENLTLWRFIAAAVALLLLGLIGLLFFLFIIRPRLGPLPQGSLLMMKEGMGDYGALGKGTIYLQPCKRQIIDAQQESMLKDYCDRLEITQDPAKWDRLTLTPVTGGSKRDLSLLMGGLTQLDNRGSGPALNLEYKVDNFEEAQKAAAEKRRTDASQVRLTWIITAALALAAAVVTWLWLPLGC